ncbi:MAG: radical SAM protein [Verrucomicrobia bacterium]|nr:radical SAM protein [Verrucomicrobiota bacterium]
MPDPYPANAAERDRWILTRRGTRSVVDPAQPYGFFAEEERAASGEVVSVNTVLLTNRECPWRCLMCDLWKHTLTEPVPPGAIPAQIDYALKRLPPARQIKLYNSGSFFDRQAIPVEDHPAIAERVRGSERVIVESHPALIGDDVRRFRDLLSEGAISSRSRRREEAHDGCRLQIADCGLEVALGLETACPEVLERLNKRLTLDQFRRAAEFLQKNEMALRVFVLVRPPFLDEAAALHWACRSIDFAFDCGATVVALIPTRGGNGALDALAQQGEFSPPSLRTVESSLDYGIGQRRGRVFVDLWDIARLATCRHCSTARVTRLRQLNLAQDSPPPVACAECSKVG